MKQEQDALHRCCSLYLALTDVWTLYPKPWTSCLSFAFIHLGHCKNMS